MNDIVNSLIEEMELCYPRTWARSSASRRAQVIGKLFLAEIHRMHLQKEKRLVEARAREKEAKAKKAEKAAKSAERSRRYHQRMQDILMKAHAYYGDMCYEYSIQLWGEEGPEAMTSGAKSLSPDQEEECMREALYAAHAEKANSLDQPWKFYDRVIAYWKKHDQF